jgi:class 3 adenylate cyclase/tetratricopeptide (TPR) repeat protein
VSGMDCPRCHAVNDTDARFCEECGAALGLVCPTCGAPVTPGKKFCRACGAQLSATGASAATRFGAPHTYTPKHLAERILLSKQALEGERKQVTVLFADLRGSLELLADRDPEDARRILDPVLERMMEAVHNYDGTVNQVMGDGIMALFGAPLALEDHAVQACYAALAMQSSVHGLSEQLRRSVGVEVQIRAGLNSGEVVVRSIGSDLHMDYTAVGQTTHLAARMEQLATPGTTRLTADTLRLAEGLVRVNALGPVPLKGMAEPVEVFELVSAGAARSRLQAAATRGLTKFVGRAGELAQIAQALERAQAGHGEVVALVGEPGVGKSRLVWEFVHSHRVQGWLVLEAGSVSYGKATAYRPVIDLLKVYFQIEDRDDPRRIREKVMGKLLALDRQLEPLLSPLLFLLDVPTDESSWQALDPPQRRQRILDACKRLLLRESQVQPLVAVFEDLHWIDSETQVFLDSLVESLPAARLLLLVNYRPEYQNKWGARTYYRQLRVDPLAGENAEMLLESLLGNDASLVPLKQLLIERTEGNPLFLEESVRTLTETGELQGSRGAYRLTASSASIEIPATVQAILAARIDRLAPEDKRLLQAAAVIGKDVPYPLLEVIGGLPDEQLRRGLSDLQAAEFLYETSLYPDLAYTFKHALTHEVAYGSVLQERRRALHMRIVEAIEGLYVERLEDQVERLAHHAFRGEVWDKAVTYLRQAGERAAARSAHREAVAHLEQAIVAAEHLPHHPESLRTQIDLRILLRSSLFPLGEHERISDHLRVGVELAAQLGDRLRVGRMVAFQAHSAWSTGDPLRAIDLASRAFATGEAEQDPALRALASFFLGQACHGHGDYRRGVQILSSTVESLGGDLERERYGMNLPISVVARVWLAFCHAELGEFASSAVRASEALRISEALGQQPYSDFHAWFALGIVHLLKGELGNATAGLEHALRVARGGGLLVMASSAQVYLGDAYLLAGDTDRALDALEQTVALGQRLGQLAFHLHAGALLAEARIASGELEQAEALALRALDLCRQHHQRGYEADALRILGELCFARQLLDLEQAVSYYGHALALAGELGMRPLVARCHFGLGRLYRRAGERALAHEHLSAAAAMFRDMGMQFWLESAETALSEQ